MTRSKSSNPDDIKLSDQLIKNLTHLVRKSGLSQKEIAALARIPSTTLNNIIMGIAINPTLHTLAAIARVFDIQIAQLVGEVPLSFTQIIVPILAWEDLDTQKSTVNYQLNANTSFISSNLITKSVVFGLRVDSRISDIYRENTTIIVEATDKFTNNNLVIVSINHTEPSIKRIVKEGADIFLESITNKSLPIQNYDPKNTHIFGVIRETRF